MMLERFTPDARAAVVHAQAHARRLGHTYVGCEHLLLAVVSVDQPAAAVLREHGLTPERVEREIVRQVGLGAGSRLFGALNRDALASVGIDLDTVRARVEESFGPEALTRADKAVHRESRTSRLARTRHWRRRRAARALPAAPVPAAAGPRQATAARPAGHIRFNPRAKEGLANTVREAQALHDNRIGVEHLALGLIAMNSQMMRSVLAALGASAQPLRAAIMDRRRAAG
ncbi:Clp protease N-terminal domain-containing protein [Streptomyces sp. NBC_01477]|uniref:Clp protease N-terminal domain-containing protein n=1 Tax=Streptomyces sp. NBC_01477 TaxID=2976015 RepID=UPI002E37B41D|nr:Clp protease N-terminal domain-containing protein [Streptomyces sp. NBC_01477]